MNYISGEEEEAEEGENSLICFSPQGSKCSVVISGIKVNLVDKE